VKIIFDEISSTNNCYVARFDLRVKEYKRSSSDSFLAMLEGDAGFEMDTFYSDAWKNPLIDSARGAHNGPAGSCSGGNAEWTVIMPTNNQGT